MASRKPPLVEFLAAVKSTNKRSALGEDRYKKKDGLDPHTNADAHQQLIVTLVLTDPDDIRGMDDFTSGPQGMARVAFRCFSQDVFKRSPRVDPNQPLLEGPAPDDELARLRAEHAEILAVMSDEPAPDSVIA